MSETGQALPELPGLIALSRFYAIAIDSLINDYACDVTVQSNPAQVSLESFLLRAKRATYAGHAAEVSSERPGAHEFVYAEDALSYRDSYFGGCQFHGQEVVRQDAQQLWCMNYSGRTLSDVFSSDFLKLALRHGTADMHYRGPRLFRNGDYTYTCDVEGSLAWFCGTEVIYYLDKLVYECRFHGGIRKMISMDGCLPSLRVSKKWLRPLFRVEVLHFLLSAHRPATENRCWLRSANESICSR